MKDYISISYLPCDRYHFIHILQIYKDMQCYCAYFFPIFQYQSHCYDTFPHCYLLLCSALMPVRFCWLSIASNCVAYLNSNLDYITIFDAAKRADITAPFLQLVLIGGILFFLITTVTSCRFLYIPPRAVLIKVSFLVGLYALLVDVGVSFSAHLVHLY